MSELCQSPCAPDGDRITVYDRRHFMIYARLLDAEQGGHGWEAAAAEILGLDVMRNPAGAEACWTSHLERARWLVGEGLVQMVTPGT